MHTVFMEVVPPLFLDSLDNYKVPSVQDTEGRC